MKHSLFHATTLLVDSPSAGCITYDASPRSGRIQIFHQYRYLTPAEELVILPLGAIVKLTMQRRIEVYPTAELPQSRFGRKAGKIKLCQVGLQICPDLKPESLGTGFFRKNRFGICVLF